MYTERLEMLIDGQWTIGTGGEVVMLENPATEELLGYIPCAGKEDLDLALQTSQRAFDQWKIIPAIERCNLLHKAADLIEKRKESISKTLTLENGKSLREAAGEIQFCADAVRWYAEESRRAYGRIIPSRAPNVRQIVVKEPVGPALGFAAWNFPAGNVTLKVAAALAAGCSIIIKPSDETPGTAIAIGRCFQDAGLPDGLLNIVFGPPAPISEYLIKSSIPKKVSLTGSTPVGKLLQKLASETMKRCTMELGGHAPVIVLDDADLDKTLDILVPAKFRNAGQVCTSPTRFYIHESLYEQFIEGFKARTELLKVGNGLDEATVIGPLITKKRLAIMDEFVEDALSKGASLVLGGKRLDQPGYFYAPTILRDVPDHANIMHDEPFGPIAPMTSFSTLDEVITRANSLPYGLAAYIFTEHAATATILSESIEAGCIGINQTGIHEVETPFGGINESGYGAEGGPEGLEAYLRTKYVAHNLA